MNQDPQGIHAKQGEIKFRRTLVRQERGEAVIHPEAMIGDEIFAVLNRGLDETRALAHDLQARSIPFSPFLELGAERAHRSLALTNEFGAMGFAFDLSLDALDFASQVKTHYGFSTLPGRVCGDAYNLPFRSHTFPFVGCFATLHHFPDPLPIVREMKRVARNGGYVYFDSEPTQGRFSPRLWTRRGHRLSRFEQVLNRFGLLGFVSDGGKLEREYGILENTFPLETWIACTELFERAEMRVNRTFRWRFDPARRSLNQVWARWFGGVASALCKVKKAELPVTASHWVELLRCPKCGREGMESILKLGVNEQALHCEQCSSRYPLCQGVWVLLPPDQCEQLYPEIKLPVV